ncbi:hypothetical protein HCU67_13585 [Muricauda sp. DJ-13]|uniref:DUF6268 domain-containing protein n=1 Tax=Croceivirga thetidis TaxID=2721623 RepID=A0ABX1GTP5_9FLAO|nr:hypothetical protein [Croceivirga thetidis]
MVRFKPKFSFVFIILMMSGWLCAQSTDLFRVEYSHLPENSSGITTSKYRVLANYPIKLKQDNYLFVGGEYNRFQVDFSKPFPFDTSGLEKFYIVDMNVGYLTNWNENWRFISIITPRMASNFTNGAQSDDFFFNATATLWKEASDADKPFRIVLGLTFNSTTGLPVPLPLVSYYKQFHPKWSYTLGTSKSNFKFQEKRHSIELALFLDGYFINVQDDIVLPDNQIGSKVSLSALITGLGYQYNITKQLRFYLIGGGTILQWGRLRNDKRQSTFLLNNESNQYFRTGIRFSLF